ncbi:MAG: hypothetical protein GY722_04005 [bacterium]|nr:hypothetical protein [bacterium]
MLLDLNETLIRTGEVEPEQRLREAVELNEFCTLCSRMADRLQGLKLVFLTGNSFEYSRRIEEPLGLKNHSGINVVIVSENGLLARDFSRGELWSVQPGEEYWAGFRALRKSVRGDAVLRECCYIQGNEIRLTFKPVRDRFSNEELALFDELIRKHDKSGTVFRVFPNPYYFDVDPRYIWLDGERQTFAGKAFAVQQLTPLAKGLEVAVGDSASDIPMFEAVDERGGRSFWVGNAEQPADYPRAQVLEGSFTNSVNRLLKGLLENPALS